MLSATTQRVTRTEKVSSKRPQTMYKRKSTTIVKRDSTSAAAGSSTMMMGGGASNVDLDEAKTPTKVYEPIGMDTSQDMLTPLKSPHSQPGQQRSVGSLVLLTQKFVDLMKANGGTIDLKAVR